MNIENLDYIYQISKFQYYAFWLLLNNTQGGSNAKRILNGTGLRFLMKLLSSFIILNVIVQQRVFARKNTFKKSQA